MKIALAVDRVMFSGRRTLLDELLTPATVMTVPVQFVCKNWIADEVLYQACLSPRRR